jgi:hypothetical protein
MMPRHTYRFDTEGHTVVEGDSAKKKEPQSIWVECKNTERHSQTLNWLFGLFKGIAFGELVAIGMTLMAQLFAMFPHTSLALMTSFPYWAIRTFGGVAMVYTWVAMGFVIVWIFDTPDTRFMI